MNIPWAYSERKFCLDVFDLIEGRKQYFAVTVDLVWHLYDIPQCLYEYGEEFSLLLTIICAILLMFIHKCLLLVINYFWKIDSAIICALTFCDGFATICLKLSLLNLSYLIRKNNWNILILSKIRNVFYVFIISLGKSYFFSNEINF